MKQIKFYALLYCDFSKESLIQNFGHDKSKDFSIYTTCCKNLQLSLKAHGFDFTVLTNDPITLLQEDPELNVMKIPFMLSVPADIVFYGAHHKIDVYEWFAQQKDDYSFLIDIDEICINNMPDNLLNLVNAEIPVYYDITSQIYPGFGRERVLHDKTLLNVNADAGLWAGGEFIGGTASFFEKLHTKILSFVEKYFTQYKNLFHQGDEMLTSTAIELLLKEGTTIFDAGSFGAIRRFWSVGTEHCQLLFPAVKDAFLLHMPADKEFIAKTPYNKDFLNKYEHYLRSEKTIATDLQMPRLFWMRVKNKLKRIFHIQ